MTIELTSEESMLLRTLCADGPVYDHDTIPQRVLVNYGLAERSIDLPSGRNMIRATPTGRQHNPPPASR